MLITDFFSSFFVSQSFNKWMPNVSAILEMHYCYSTRWWHCNIYWLWWTRLLVQSLIVLIFATFLGLPMGAAIAFYRGRQWVFLCLLLHYRSFHFLSSQGAGNDWSSKGKYGIWFPVSHFPRCFGRILGVWPYFLGVSGYEQEAVGGARNMVNRICA